jgi:hypothetical protein
LCLSGKENADDEQRTSRKPKSPVRIWSSTSVGQRKGKYNQHQKELIRICAQQRIAFNPGTVERKMERIVGKSGIQKVTGAIPMKLGSSR